MATDKTTAGHATWLQRVWYGDAGGGWLLWPLEGLFRGVAAARRISFRLGLSRSRHPGVPVIVIGNIAVGGAGKTPLVAWLVKRLQTLGWTPAIVSRGYGGAEPRTPLRVERDTSPAASGDEALMLKRQTDAAVFVCRRRVAACAAAVAAGADIIVSDDGLQHYAMARDVEIVVVDGQAGHGNGHCLPAGPLREPLSRLARADLVVTSDASPRQRPGYRLTVSAAVHAVSGETRALATFAGTTVHALAAIGHPQRFYAALEALDIVVRPMAARDHERLGIDALSPPDEYPVLMTEKDAVKYHALKDRHWIVPAEVTMDSDSERQILALIPERSNA